MKRIIIPVAVIGLLVAASALAAEGDVVRTDTSNPFLLDAQASRLAFPDEATYRTWGSPASETVAESRISQWRVRGVMPLREGSALVRFGTDPEVYAVSPGGVLHHVARPSFAIKLYGADWQKKVVSLFSSYWANYKIGAPIESAAHPEGTVFKYAGNSTVYYLTNGVMRPFASEKALKANRFSLDSVIIVPNDVTYVKGNLITGYERDLQSVLTAARP